MSHLITNVKICPSEILLNSYNFYQANIGPFHCHYSEITEHKHKSLIMILEENFRRFLHLRSSFVLILVSFHLY